MSVPSSELDAQHDLGLRHAASPLSLPGFLEAVTARFGTRVALRFEGRDLRFDDLSESAHSIARALLACGVERGDRVALLISNRPEWATAFFGAALVGAIVVPVNTFATPEERDYILRHSDARLLLMQGQDGLGVRALHLLLQHHRSGRDEGLLVPPLEAELLVLRGPRHVGLHGNGQRLPEHRLAKLVAHSKVQPEVQGVDPAVQADEVSDLVDPLPEREDEAAEGQEQRLGG